MRKLLQLGKSVFLGLAALSLLLATPGSVLADDYTDPANVHIYTALMAGSSTICMIVVTWDEVGADSYALYADASHVYGGTLPADPGSYNFEVNGQQGIGFYFGEGAGYHSTLPSSMTLYSTYNSLLPTNQGNYGTGVTLPVNQSCPNTLLGNTPTNSPPGIDVFSLGGRTIGLNSSVVSTARFSDEDAGDTHTASWDWGDNTSPSAGTVTEKEGYYEASGTHTFTTLGLHTGKLTITDSNGNSVAGTIYHNVVDYLPPTFDGVYSDPDDVNIYTSPAGPGICKIVVTWKEIWANGYTLYADDNTRLYGVGTFGPPYDVNGLHQAEINIGEDLDYPTIPSSLTLYSYYNSLWPENEGNYGTGVTLPVDQNCPNTLPGEATPIISLNAGGSTVDTFTADANFSGGTTYSTAASVDTSDAINAAPAAVYQSARYGNMTYTLSDLTPNADYTLRLHFNELYFGIGNNGGGVDSRVFNVTVNSQAALTNYDIFATAGGANKAITEQLPVTADGSGNITINFSSVIDNSMISGIELYTGTLPAQAPNPEHQFSTVINAGGGAAGSFVADYNFTGGTVYSTAAAVDTNGVTNPAPESIYQSVRYGSSFGYNVPRLTPNTSYVVRLHFNELYFTSTGSRVFNVSINGTQVLGNFDIYATAGAANKAVIEEFTVQSDANGKLNLQFTGTTDNAMVSGIEIYAAQ